MNFYQVLAVGTGGFLGSVARYASTLILAKKINTDLPYPTLAINIVGSFLLGVFIGYSLDGNKNESLKLFLTTGFCGGFTTFSAFAVENVNLMQNKMTAMAILYIILSVVCTLLAAFAGLIAAKTLS
jgi:fluoride exporter